MPPTETLTFKAESAHVYAVSKNVVSVEVLAPDVEAILTAIYTDDLIKYVSTKMGPEEIFSTTELEKWAESEGYVKAQ